MFVFHQMAIECALSITGWTYPEPYDIYNTAPERRPEVAKSLCTPAFGYESIHSAPSELVGFWCGGPDARVGGGNYDDEALDLGLGLRPDLTGKGRGRELVQAVVRRAKTLHGDVSMRVTVAVFNARAMRVWESAGFVGVSRFRRGSDGLEFALLTRIVGG